MVCSENDAAADNSLQCIIRVMDRDLTTVRGVLYAGHSAALNSTPGALGEEMSTPFTNRSTRIFDSVPVTSVSALDGDRIVVEMGYRAHNTVTTPYSSTLRLDPVGGTDRDLTSGLTGSADDWIQFGQTLSFAQEVRLDQQVISSEEALGSPTITVTVSPDGIGSAEALGGPAVSIAQVLAPTGIASAEALGNPTITTGPVTVALTGVSSAEALGIVTVALTVSLDGISSAEAVGAVTLPVPLITARPDGVVGAEELGQVSVLQELFYVTPPTREVYEWGESGLLRYYLQTEGVTWYKVGSEWSFGNYLPDDLTVDEMYRGGREYQVDATKAAEL